MRLFNHSFIKHPALVMFLIFCLPAQSLAAVLIECKQHQQKMSAQQHTNVPVALGAQTVVADCHGAAQTVSHTINAEPETADHHIKAAEPAGPADTNDCFHCSGVCQNLKPFSLAEPAQYAQAVDARAFSRIAPDTATGVSNNPSRPPCPYIPS